MAEPLRVLIVEDDPGTREALAAGVRLGGHVVVSAVGTGEAAVAMEGEPPDVALVDLGLPGIDGVETIRRLRARHPELPCLVLTVFEAPAAIVAAIEAGAGGYLLKERGLADLVRSIEQVREGAAPLSPAVARQLVERLAERERAAAAPGELLTPREQQVLELLVGGHSYPAIANALGIGTGTVQGYVKNVYRKLQVSSKAAAASVAVRRGLVGRS